MATLLRSDEAGRTTCDEYPDSVHFPRLLADAASGERPGEKATSHHRHELSALHHGRPSRRQAETLRRRDKGLVAAGSIHAGASFAG